MTKKIRAVQMGTLLLVALYMGQQYAHVLEIGPKLHYPPQLYLRLQTSLYAWYGPPLGAALSIGALIATGALTWLVRRQPAARWLTGAALALQVAALAIYFARVEPVNVRFRELAPGQLPSDFLALRTQWDYGHAMGFALFVVAFVLLAISMMQPIVHRPRASRQSGQVLEHSR